MYSGSRKLYWIRLCVNLLLCLQVVNASAHLAWWSTSRIILLNNSFRFKNLEANKWPKQSKTFFFFLVQSSHVRIWSSVCALWMGIFHSPLDLVTYKYCAVSYCSCEMLWPKLDKNHSTQVDKFSKILFWEELTVFLSVCTIYFLNIKGCGNLLSRQLSFSFLSMHSTCKMLYVWTVKMAKQFFTISMYLYV